MSVLMILNLIRAAALLVPALLWIRHQQKQKKRRRKARM